MAVKSIGIVCTSTGFGGLEMNTLKLADWLERRGWQVRWLVNEVSPLSKAASNSFKDVTTIQKIKSTASKCTAGILHKWLSPATVPLLFTPYNKDIKSLSAYKRFRNRLVKLVYQQHMKVGVKKRDLIHRLRYNMLDLWISPLPYLKQETLEKTPVPEERIKIIHLGLDPAQFTSSVLDPESARTQLAIPPGKPILGVLGRIDPKKGQDFVIRAIAHLRDVHHKIYYLLIMGNVTPNEGDEYLQKLNNLVTTHSLQQEVFFRPYQADVNLFYKAIDVFLMPSHGETYGMVTLEAMLSERPVLGVNTDGTAELLQHGKLGWLHNLEDLESFCQQLFAMETDAGKGRILSAAKEAVINQYSETEAMQKTEAALLQLLG